MFLSITIAVILFSSFLAYASFSISSGVYLRVFCRKQTKEKLVALTFDDGPHPEYTPQVLDVLNRYRTKATFFIIGRNIAGNEKILRKIHANGHQTGIHSFSHKNTFPFSGAKKIAEELLQCEQAIDEAAGYRARWFRPPFGVTNPDIAKAVKAGKYKVAGWSIRSLDTLYKDKNKTVQRVVSRLHPGAVILLHDRLPDTPYMLEQIIRQTMEKGYAFVTMEQLFETVEQ